MRTITVDHLISYLQSATIETDYDLSPERNQNNDIDGSVMRWGWIWNTLTVPGLIEIAYQNLFEYPEHKPSMAETCSDVPDLWEPVRLDVQVVDEDGDVLSLYEIGDIILDHTAIDRFDLTVLGEDDVEDVA